MVIRFRFFNMLLAFLLAAGPAEAQEPLHFKGNYEFTFSNILIGKMGLEIAEGPDQYSITGDILTSGLLKLFVQHSSHTTALGKGENYRYNSVVYESNYQTRKKKKHVQMRYENGAVTLEELIPPDNRATRPAVPAELKKDSADPMSLILRIHENLAAAMAHNAHNFTLNGYDGRRLTKIDFTIIGKQTLNLRGNAVPVVLVDVKRSLLAGFTQQELDEIHPPEPPLHIYFKDDAALTPLRLEATLWMGTVAATLAKECAAGESCLLGIRD